MKKQDKVKIVGDRVFRTPGFYTAQIHSLLTFLRCQGFLQAPEPLGFDEQGKEVLTYVAGNTFETLVTEEATSQEALVSSAKLLRLFHDISQNYLKTKPENSGNWMFPAKEPQEVICHNDFAPYNICFEGSIAIGLIDFDAAIPGPKTWDIAYAIYRFAPFYNAGDVEVFGNIEQQINRAKLFCDTYNLSNSDRSGLVDLMIERLQELLTHLLNSAEEGNKEFIQNINEGHHKKYISDINYIKQHKIQIENGLHTS